MSGGFTRSVGRFLLEVGDEAIRSTDDPYINRFTIKNVNAYGENIAANLSVMDLKMLKLLVDECLLEAERCYQRERDRRRDECRRNA